jgi:PAS domain S-box-containing protein
MSQTEALNVLLASEQAEDTKQCTVSLRGMFPGCRVEAVYSAAEMRQCVTQRDWDVMLIDEQFSLGNDLEIMAELRSRAPRTAIIVQTESDDKTRAAQIAEGGADYCLHKNSATFFTELPIVMREVLERRELRLQLDLARQRYDRLTERMTDLVFQLDQEGRFTHVSQRAFPLLGYTAEDLIGKQYVELIHPDDRHSAKNRFNEKRSGARATDNMNIRLLPKSGADSPNGILDVEFSATGLYSGRIFQGTIGVIRDKSWRTQELHTLEGRLQQKFDSQQDQKAAEHQQRETELREEIQRREDNLRQEQLSNEQQAKQRLEKMQSQQKQLQQGDQQHQEREAQLSQRLQRQQEEFEQQLKDQEAQLQEAFQGRQTQLSQELKDQEDQLQEEFKRQAELLLQQEEAQLLEQKEQLSSQYELHYTGREKELHQQYQHQVDQLNQKLKALQEEHAEEPHQFDSPTQPKAQGQQAHMRQELTEERRLELQRREEQLRKGSLRWKLWSK